MKRNLLLMLSVCAAFVACRGGISHKPPIHLVPDMDNQQKIKAQSEFKFDGWDDHRGMRPPVAGTVARGSLELAELARVKDGDAWRSNPLAATRENLERGQQRYDIYCAVCHDRAGSGNGMVIQRAPTGSFAPTIPHLASEVRLREMSDGELCQTIAMGKATMPAYGHMVTPSDRWAIVHYLRALQNRIKQ